MTDLSQAELLVVNAQAESQCPPLTLCEKLWMADFIKAASDGQVNEVLNATAAHFVKWSSADAESHKRPTHESYFAFCLSDLQLRRAELDAMKKISERDGMGIMPR